MRREKRACHPERSSVRAKVGRNAVEGPLIFPRAEAVGAAVEKNLPSS
jgi:hypothetical protein